MITLRYVTSPTSTGKAFKFKTLAGARTKARNLVGSYPKLDPDGYAVQRTTGNCLFFQGVTFDELFPRVCPFCKQPYNPQGLCINPKCWVDSNPKETK